MVSFNDMALLSSLSAQFKPNSSIQIIKFTQLNHLINIPANSAVPMLTPAAAFLAIIANLLTCDPSSLLIDLTKLLSRQK